ncbi:gamma-glutamyltransferase [Brevibacillus humidisoli]|nr:gamma-glutamyltransferase [Brevibacillus humidisoli]UFJ43198.1 gamma-glutamyltransferase [Brevibacillus humidisoli]
MTPVFAAVPGVSEEMPSAAKGIVAVSHPLAAEVGKTILAEGGNAVDAAAGIQLALNVVEPMMSGIGGGGFMMIYLKEKNEIKVIDSREMAPQKATPDLFLDENGKPIPWFQRHTSGNAVGVPGTLKGVEYALEQYGTMPLSQVIDPAITYARDGFKVNWSMEQYIAENIEKLQQYGTAAEVFIPDGKPLQEGDLLVQPDLAKTFSLIKEKGSDALYNGEIGEALVAEVQKRGGVMTTDDLQQYQVKEREPVRGMYRGYEVVSMSPPSSGGLTVLQILKLMEGYNVEKMGVNSPEYLHRLIEAMHLAYADRAMYMADEDFYPVPKTGLIDDEYIKQRQELIHPRIANANVQAGDPWKYEPDGENKKKRASVQEENPIGQTTHFSVIDQWGNMVSYTTTIEQVFGTGIMVPGYGFMLNNEMTDFDAEPGGVNQVEPGKRPRSSMSPTMALKDGQPFMAVGSPGGPTIITSVAQTIINVIDHKLPIQKAIETPRIYSSSYPNVRWEAGIEQDVILDLMSRGHVFEEQPQDIGNVQAVLFDYETGKMYGGADNTREGTVLGVDAVSFVQPEPDAPALWNPSELQLKVNGARYPFAEGQLVLQDGTVWAAAAQLELALGIESNRFAKLETTVNGDVFLPVRKVAETLGYKVGWDQADQAVLLEKEQSPVSENEVQKAYQEDVYKITN